MKMGNPFNSWLVMFPVLLISALSFLSFFLHKQNRSYQEQNRNLIIQNDSILSVNVELKQTLQQKDSVMAQRIPSRKTASIRKRFRND